MLNIVSVDVLNNPCSFLDPFLFKINFECHEAVSVNELQWKVIYVGSAESENFDQILLEGCYGPFETGQHSVILSSKQPDPSKIPPDELEGVTVVLIVGRHQRFEQCYQIGYYVRHEYPEEKDPNSQPEPHKLKRTVLDSNPSIQILKAGCGEDVSQLENIFAPLVIEKISKETAL